MVLKVENAIINLSNCISSENVDVDACAALRCYLLMLCLWMLVGKRRSSRRRKSILEKWQMKNIILFEKERKCKQQN